MARIPGIRRYLRAGRGSKATVRRDIDAELAFHFGMAVDELIARGLTREDAEREAERRFGNVAAVRDRLARLDQARLGDERRADWWNALGQDTRYAARGLRRSLGFTVGVVLTLALGIGANAAVFSLIDRLLLRAPPHVVDAGTLRRVHVDVTLKNGRQSVRGPMSYAEFDALRNVGAFEAVGAFNYPTSVALGQGIDAPRIERSGASAEFFRVLGVAPELGRFFVAEDDDDAVSRPAAVLSYGIWQRRFGARRDVVGEPLVLDGRPYVIVGVTPKGFSGADVDAPEVWIPLEPSLAAGLGPKWRANTLAFGTHVIARLKLGVAEERAAAEASRLVKTAHEGTFFADLQSSVRLGSVIPGRRLDNRDAGLSVATRLVGAAAMVLLIACANVANLLLARALARRRELAVRLALGVGRGRLIAQLLTESLLLALVAGSVALGVAVWGGSLLRALLMPNVAWATPPVDVRVLAFTGAIACAVGLLAGLVPAFQMTGDDLVGSLKAGWRDRTRGRSMARAALILVQAAFTVILLVGAGLFVRSLYNVRTLDLGFALDRTILATIDFAPGTAAPNEGWEGLYADFATRVRSVPGVASVSVTATAPFWTISFERIFLPGRDSLPPELRAPPIHPVDHEFLAAMGIRLTRGRSFTPDDRRGAPGVAIVNAAMARRLWPDEAPLGKCLKLGADSAPCTTVVGVVRDVAFMNTREERPPQFYIPLAQASPSRNRYLVVRLADGVRDAREAGARVRSALRGADARIEGLDVRPMTELLEPEIRPFRVGATMFGVFGVIALLLAGVGLYAVVSFDVARRTRELGIRTALGARSGDVVRLVLGQGLRITAVGVAIGLLLALALGRIVEALLFDVTARDPAVFGLVAVTLLAVAAAASIAPAWRAGRVDPVVALREE